MAAKTEHIFTGVLPADTEPFDEVLVTVWSDGTAEMSFRRGSSYGPPINLRAGTVE